MTLQVVDERDARDDVPLVLRPAISSGDRVFRGLMRGARFVVLAITGVDPGVPKPRLVSPRSSWEPSSSPPSRSRWPFRWRSASLPYGSSDLPVLV